MNPGEVFVYFQKLHMGVMDYRIVLTPGTALFLETQGDIHCMEWCFFDTDDYVQVEISQ